MLQFNNWAARITSTWLPRLPLWGCEKMGTVPSAAQTLTDFKGIGMARSGLSPIFSQPLCLPIRKAILMSGPLPSERARFPSLGR